MLNRMHPVMTMVIESGGPRGTSSYWELCRRCERATMVKDHYQSQWLGGLNVRQ